MISARAEVAHVLASIRLHSVAQTISVLPSASIMHDAIPPILGAIALTVNVSPGNSLHITWSPSKIPMQHEIMG